MDRRRRQWFPLDIYIAEGNLGQALLRRWQHEGLVTWILFLAACMRSETGPQGEFHYPSEPLGWQLLGAGPAVPADFTLKEFFDFTGRFKKTQRRRQGVWTYVTCTSWERWNNSITTQQRREQRASKQGVNVPTLARQSSDPTTTTTNRTTNPPLVPPEGLIFEHWKTARSKPKARLTDNRRRKISKRLATFSESDLIRAIDGVAFDPWEERSLQDDLTIIFRSDEQVEKFLALADNPPSRNGRMSEAEIQALAEE